MPQVLPALAPNPPTRRSYAPGDLLVGKYRLTRLLGQGGMGDVWEATHVALDAPRAIKLIRAEFEVPSSKARLLQEAHSIAKLDHPGIVRVVDVGEVDGTDEPFMVMELLKGETLRDVLLRCRRLSAPLCVQTLLPIADALSAVHRFHIVHRDLKPDNVFLVEAGERRVQPKLFDFGVVKVEEAQKSSRLTRLDTVVGSPDYMSPEQARGSDNVDHRADIWAFCVMLYEVLTGQVPFAGTNYNALLRAIVEEKERPIEEFAVGDQDLNFIVHFGLHKDREQRWQTMEELGRALAESLLRQGIHEDVAGKGLAARWMRRDGEQGQRTREFKSMANSESPFLLQRRACSSGEPDQGAIAEHLPLALEIVLTPTAVGTLALPGGGAPSPIWRKRAPLLLGGMLLLPLLGLGGLQVSRSGAMPTEVQLPAGRAAPTATRKSAGVVKLAPRAAAPSIVAAENVLPETTTKLEEDPSSGPQATASAAGSDAGAAPKFVERRRAALPKRSIPKSNPAAPPLGLKVPY